MLVVAGLLPSPATLAGSPLPRIDEPEARTLVLDVVEAHNPDAELTSAPRGDDSEFYFFSASWPNRVGSPIIGYFAVNPLDG